MVPRLERMKVIIQSTYLLEELIMRRNTAVIHSVKALDVVQDASDHINTLVCNANIYYINIYKNKFYIYFGAHKPLSENCKVNNCEVIITLGFLT